LHRDVQDRSGPGNPELTVELKWRWRNRMRSRSEEFDQAYRLPITFWGDARIPREVTELARGHRGASVIELGCGIGRCCRFMARLGLKVTGIDFSRVAIERATRRSTGDPVRPSYRVGDVTGLGNIGGPFDLSLDVGCFHCLDEAEREKYAAEVFRVLKPGGTHLLWVMDTTPPPASAPLTPDMVRTVFEGRFILEKASESRRRIVRSHWYWLRRP